MGKKLLIVASKRYGDYVKEIAESMGCFEAISFVDNDREDAIGKLEEVETFYPEYRYAIAACDDGAEVGLSVLCIFAARLLGKIYGQVWRYGGIQCYIRLLFTDSIAFVAYLGLELLLPVQKITFDRCINMGQWLVNAVIVGIGSVLVITLISSIFFKSTVKKLVISKIKK